MWTQGRRVGVADLTLQSPPPVGEKGGLGAADIWRDDPAVRWHQRVATDVEGGHGSEGPPPSATAGHLGKAMVVGRAHPEMARVLSCSHSETERIEFSPVCISDPLPGRVISKFFQTSRRVSLTFLVARTAPLI